MNAVEPTTLRHHSCNGNITGSYINWLYTVTVLCECVFLWCSHPYLAVKFQISPMVYQTARLASIGVWSAFMEGRFALLEAPQQNLLRCHNWYWSCHMPAHCVLWSWSNSIE